MTFLSLLAIVVLHESAHAVVALACGLRVKRVVVCSKGIGIVRAAGTPLENLWITLAGPLCNLALAGLWPLAPHFAFLNLVFGVANLLPFPHSDGRRAYAALQQVLCLN